jgi:hypothetical protein
MAEQGPSHLHHGDLQISEGLFVVEPILNRHEQPQARKPQHPFREIREMVNDGGELTQIRLDQTPHGGLQCFKGHRSQPGVQSPVRDPC